MMEHPTVDDFWRRGQYDRYPEMTVPALNVTGWWDMNFPGAPLNFEAMRREAATANARAGQKLIIGPWPHLINRTRELSGLDFGDDALIELDAYIVKFFDRYLKNKANSIEDDKPVQVFVSGANEWWRSAVAPRVRRVWARLGYPVTIRCSAIQVPAPANTRCSASSLTSGASSRR